MDFHQTYTNDAFRGKDGFKGQGHGGTKCAQKLDFSGLLAQYLKDCWIDIHQTFSTGEFWDSENVSSFRSKGRSVQVYAGRGHLVCQFLQSSSLCHIEHPKIKLKLVM